MGDIFDQIAPDKGSGGGDIFDQIAPDKPLSTGQKVARAIAPYARPALEGTGATVGGVLGAPGGPVGEATGIGVGYLTGKYAANALDEYAGTRQTPTVGGKAKEALTQDLPEAATTGMAGPIVGKVVQGAKDLGKWGLGKFMAGGIDSEGASRMAAMEKAGINPTPAEVTKKPSHAILESELEKNIGSADVARQNALTKMKQAQDYAAKIETQYFGGKNDVYSAGQTAQAAAKGRYAAFQKVASQLYDSVPVSPTEPIETHTLANTAREYQEELGKLQGSAIKRVLKLAESGEKVIPGQIVDASGKPLTSTTEPTYTWQQLRDDQSTILKMAKASTDPNRKRILMDLHRAINDDISAFGDKAGDPDIKKTLEMANKFYRQGTETTPGVKDFREQKIASTVMKSQNPEDISRKYMTSTANQSDLTRLQKVVGPKGYRAIKQAWFSDMIGQGESASFSPARYVTSYEKYMRGGNLDTMLSPKEKEGADALYKVSKIMVDAEKLANNPSGTGRIMVNDLYKWAKHPIIETMTQIGSKKMAEQYFNNPDFQKLLIFGLKQGPESKLAAQTAKMLTNMAVGGGMGMAQ